MASEEWRVLALPLALNFNVNPKNRSARYVAVMSAWGRWGGALSVPPGAKARLMLLGGAVGSDCQRGAVQHWLGKWWFADG